MSEQQLREVLSAYGASARAPEQFGAITRQVAHRRTRRRWIRSATAAVALSFAFMTFAPVGGSALATVRREIQPTLFLKTDLATARETIREPLTLPDTFPDYRGATGLLTDETPALVGRWLSYELVAVTVTSEPEAMGVIHFDLRRTNYRPAPDEEWWMEPPGTTAQAVEIGEYDGLVYLDDGRPMTIKWQTEAHTYRLLAPGCESVEQLVALAEQID